MDGGDAAPQRASGQRHRARQAAADVASRKRSAPPPEPPSSAARQVTPPTAEGITPPGPPPSTPSKPSTPQAPPIPRQVITAPPAPQRRSTPHNLFTWEEIRNALALLAADLDPTASQMVELTWANGGSYCLPTYQLHRIGDPEDVRTLALDWTYPDASRVRGELVTRSRLPSLTLEGAGTARAALGTCLDHLQSLRPQRGRWRAFMAGAGGFDLDALLALLAVGVVICIWATSPEVHADLLDRDGWPGTLALCALQFVAFSWLMRKLHRAFAGTRLAREPVAHRSWLTAELGVLVGVLTLVSTVVFGVLALLL